ncbi:MAG TPA: ABC transporter substrate-binding protein [Candidatus Binatia bacterium]|jgi:NitT/TauT family transport system substrate-binding protein|nr:ABC transporter substrate-binding protein [Candidatus Binatia bacterium]
MNNRRFDHWSRREFLSALTLAGTAGFLGVKAETLAAEAPPETTSIRLAYHSRSLCHAPLYVAEDSLRGEGFTDVQYVKTAAAEKALASGEVDVVTFFCGPLAIQVDKGDPIVLLSGLHPGCVELVGTEQIRSIRDLKGKTVAVTDLGGGRHAVLAVMAAHVGIDPRKDINIVEHPAGEAMRLLAEKKIDGFLAAPPDAQQLRAKKIGHVVINTMMDKPWSQYFCCMVAMNQQFVLKNPVATKRALRAILRATDTTSREPERAARFLVNKGYAKQYDHALQAMNEMGIGYSKWRDYDPEDTMRFYALRMNEVGMIKSSPQKLIAQGTDWRFLKELKKEMKG